MKTNIAAMRIEKKMISVLPKLLNWRAAAGSIPPSAYWALTATTELAAAPTKKMATNRIPLTSWRFDCRALRRRARRGLPHPERDDEPQERDPGERQDVQADHDRSRGVARAVVVDDLLVGRLARRDLRHQDEARR